jgi:hypothetical protein
VRLQSVVWVNAKPADEFKPGERMGWNFGSTTEVISRVSETASFVIFEIKDQHGKLWHRKLKKDRLVAIAQ